jgi:hypothetical protein
MVKHSKSVEPNTGSQVVEAVLDTRVNRADMVEKVEEVVVQHIKVRVLKVVAIPTASLTQAMVHQGVSIPVVARLLTLVVVVVVVPITPLMVVTVDPVSLYCAHLVAEPPEQAVERRMASRFANGPLQAAKLRLCLLVEQVRVHPTHGQSKELLTVMVSTLL